MWIPKLLTYQTGPADRFGNQVPVTRENATRFEELLAIVRDDPRQEQGDPIPPDVLPADLQPDGGAWDAIRAHLQTKINRHSFDTWIVPLRVLGLKERVLYVRVPVVEFKHVTEKYADLIGEALPDSVERLELLCCEVGT